MSRLWWRVAALWLVVMVIPVAAYAQASIAGVVRDTSGAILPGVTVEASSPALIEKVRTAITDGSGQYRIVALDPGTYAVTFTLTGFNSVIHGGPLTEGRLNTDAVQSYNQAFVANGSWLTPTGILAARFAKITAQLDF